MQNNIAVLSRRDQKDTLFADDVPRVKIKVFRGPTQEGDGEYFATWGYWIQQPNR